MVCELVFQTLELAVGLALVSCPGVKLLPAFLACKFSGHMEDWIFILTSCSEIMCKFPGRACAAGLCVVQICQKTPLLSFLLCLVSEQKKLQPLSFYRSSIGAENSSYAPWICSVRWLSVFCWGVRCCLWRLLKLFKLECFPAHVQFSGEWTVLELRGWMVPPVQKVLRL